MDATDLLEQLAAASWAPDAITFPDDDLLAVSAVPAASVASGDEVRPLGWNGFVAALGAERLDDTHVQLRWRCDPGDQPPGPVTVFRNDELVAVRR